MVNAHIEHCLVKVFTMVKWPTGQCKCEFYYSWICMDLSLSVNIPNIVRLTCFQSLQTFKKGIWSEECWLKVGLPVCFVCIQCVCVREDKGLKTSKSLKRSFWDQVTAQKSRVTPLIFCQENWKLIDWNLQTYKEIQKGKSKITEWNSCQSDNIAWWIKISSYVSASILSRSLTPLASM